MKERLRYLAGRSLRRLFSGLRLVAREWRLWLGAALLGALLATGWRFIQPPLWASEGYLLLRPLSLREGHLLSADELGPYYVVRLLDEARIARALELLDIEATVDEVRGSLSASARRGGILHLRVALPERTHAEALTGALLGDLRQELEAENRIREPVDRLVVRQSLTRFGWPALPGYPVIAGLGGLIGALTGLLLAAGRVWYRTHRVAAPLEAERLVGAPTLVAIPARRRLPF